MLTHQLLQASKPILKGNLHTIDKLSFPVFIDFPEGTGALIPPMFSFQLGSVPIAHHDELKDNSTLNMSERF